MEQKLDITNAEATTLKDSRISEVIACLTSNEDTIHNAAHRTFGINGWFKAYLQSPEFGNLSSERKVEAFESYENLKFVLIELDYKMDELKGEEMYFLNNIK